MPLFLFVYPFFYGSLLFLLRIISPLQPKIRKGLRLRSGKIKPWLNYPENSQPLWIHCASGEFEYAKPIIREIKSKWPQQKVLITFFSPSVLSSLEKAKDVDFFCPLPWDKKSEFNEFIEHHKPKALLIARTDLWPNMIEACARKKVPSLLFSKTVNTKKSGLAKWVEKKLLKKITSIFCVSPEDRDLLLKQLKNYTEVHSAGDTRYDQCFFRLKHGQTLKPINNFYRPIFVIGSSWTGDEEVLLPAIKEFKNDISFIIAPHEPTNSHLKKLEKKLDSLGLNYSRYSKTQSWNPESVLLIDQIGILADLYAWGNFSFIGGSMDRSVHSVMESLAQGCLTFVGPNHHNNREALLFQKINVDQIQPVQVVHDTDELTQKLRTSLPLWSSQQKIHLQQEIQKKLGASQIVIKWICNHTELK